MMVCSASSVSVCTLYKHQPLLLHHPPQPKTPPRRPFQLGISVKKTTSISYITKPHHHNSSRFRCTSLLTSEIAPVASAAYGVLLLGGGLFACNLFPCFFCVIKLIKFTFFYLLVLFLQIQELRVKGHFSVDLLGLLSWAL